MKDKINAASIRRLHDAMVRFFVTDELDRVADVYNAAMALSFDDYNELLESMQPVDENELPPDYCKWLALRDACRRAKEGRWATEHPRRSGIGSGTLTSCSE